MSRLLLTLVLGLAACGDSRPPVTSPPVQQPASKAGSIGSAKMLDDGTIQLQLRAEGDGGMVGDALLVYPPSHADYQRILTHLGGMKPGESKPVPPFPDKP